VNRQDSAPTCSASLARCTSSSFSVIVGFGGESEMIKLKGFLIFNVIVDKAVGLQPTVHLGESTRANTWSQELELWETRLGRSVHRAGALELVTTRVKQVGKQTDILSACTLGASYYNPRDGWLVSGSGGRGAATHQEYRRENRTSCYCTEQSTQPKGRLVSHFGTQHDPL
jgi:hypothetical protein